MKRIVAIAILAASTFSLSVSVGAPLAEAQEGASAKARKPRRMTGAQVEWEIFDRVNAERVKAGLARLDWDPDLLVISRKHAEAMSRDGAISHLEGGEVDLSARLRRGGFRSWSVVGENIAQNRGSTNPAKRAFEKWLNSENHRRNILDPRWEVTAVGVAIDRAGQYFIVQDFIAYSRR
jgi:uncharacterized protein YkwD